MSANASGKWFEFLYELTKVMYEKSRKLVGIFYKSLPILATKYIQIHHMKYEGKEKYSSGLDKVMMMIYNQERSSYNDSQKEKS